MRQINTALKYIVIAVMLVHLLMQVALLSLPALGWGVGAENDYALLILVVTLLLFSLFCLLWEITENTRVLRDAVQSGSLKVSVTNDPVQSIEERKRDNLSLDGGLDSLHLRP